MRYRTRLGCCSKWRQLGTLVFTMLPFWLALTSRAQAQAYSYSVLYSFTGSGGDGANPSGALITDAAGNLYGTTIYAGAGYGTLFKISPSGNETILHAFNLTDGSGPQGALVRDATGNLYGITGAGGTLGSGTVFKLDTSANLTVLYNVPAQPRAGLIMDSAGNLYGTTFLGGAFNNAGTVFKLDTSGIATILHSFGGTATDGILPTARLILDSAGNLYGTTENGGAFSYGTVFKIDSSGSYAVLHNFNNTDGAFPAAGVTLDSAGSLYGTTFDGGSNNLGVVYKLNTAGNLTVLHSFTGSTDGAKPISDLVLDSAGNIYGTTALGGGSGFGNAFKLDTAGNVTSLHGFTNTPDGNEPAAGLLMDTAGNLYGTTLLGGASGKGTVFKLAAPAELSNFTAHLFVEQEDYTTGVRGKFTPTSTINLVTQAVTLSISGADSFTVTFTPGSFTNVSGRYVARATVGLSKVNLSLVPRSNGSWKYSASIRHFVPESTSASVTLTIGAQSGTATVNVKTEEDEEDEEDER